jgi:hypothetical protein
MTLALTANILLTTIVFVVIVGMLGRTIHTSAPRRNTRPARAGVPQYRVARRSLGSLARQS